MTTEHSIPSSGTGRETRITRGIRLFENIGSEIIATGDGTFSVPSKSNDGTVYSVNLEAETCECRDYTDRLSKLPAPMACLHQVAATIHRAKRPVDPALELPTPAERVIDFVPFEIETLDGVYVDGITALVADAGGFFVADYPTTGDDAGACMVLDASSDFERMRRAYEEITGHAVSAKLERSVT